MKKIKCPECGGHDIRRESGNILYCGYCGNRYFSEDPGAENEYTGVDPGKKQRVIAAAAAGAVLLLAAAAAVFFFFIRIEPESQIAVPSSIQTNPRPLVESGPGDVEPEKKAAAVVERINPVADTIGNIYFLGFIKNTGETVIRPLAELTLYNEDKTKAAVATGYAPRNYLLPGEETPVMILVQKAPAYKSLKTNPGLDHPFYFSLRPDLKFHGLKMSRPSGGFIDYRITGTVENRDSFAGKHVQLIAVLLDAENRPVGMGTAYLGQQQLPPGDTAPFSVAIYTSTGKPVKFVMDYDAQSDKRGSD
jgi:hypothetical protein